jgi:uncharacterized protein (DUF169 family)
MKSIEDCRKAGQELFDRLHLATYPVAIKYVKDPSEFEAGMVRPSAMGQKDNFCVPATVWHRWVDIPWEEFIQSQIRQGWHRDEEAERKRCAYGIAMMGEKNLAKAVEYIGFISSPLPFTAVVPDTVLMYGNAENVTHIIHALAYGGEHFPTSTFEGFGESCMKGGLLPFITGIPQVVIPGMGDRAFSGTYDYEIAIGFPGTLLPMVMEDCRCAPCCPRASPRASPPASSTCATGSRKVKVDPTARNLWSCAPRCGRPRTWSAHIPLHPRR